MNNRQTQFLKDASENPKLKYRGFFGVLYILAKESMTSPSHMTNKKQETRSKKKNT